MGKKRKTKYYVLDFEPIIGKSVNLVLTGTEFNKAKERYDKWEKLKKVM